MLQIREAMSNQYPSYSPRLSRRIHLRYQELILLCATKPRSVPEMVRFWQMVFEMFFQAVVSLSAGR